MASTRTVIVGAGLAGLLCARRLRAAGRDVLLLDKGRGVGGRLATRRTAEGASFDHGAQFFTVRSDTFRVNVDKWLAAGVVREWCRGFLDHDAQPHSDGHPRYIGVGGMNAIAKHLAAGLDVRTGVTVRAIHAERDTWRLDLPGGEAVAATDLLLTPPVPQSLALLPADLPLAARAELEALTYEPCTSVLLLLDRTPPLPEPAAIQIPAGEPLSWLSDNTRKGTSREGVAAITIHAGPEFTRRTWDTDATTVVSELVDAAQTYLGDARVLSHQLHRWRYSRPLRQHEERCLVVDGPPRVVFAGDAFGEPRVEGAALSGLAAAEALLR